MKIRRFVVEIAADDEVPFEEIQQRLGAILASCPVETGSNRVHWAASEVHGWRTNLGREQTPEHRARRAASYKATMALRKNGPGHQP